MNLQFKLFVLFLIYSLSSCSIIDLLVKDKEISTASSYPPNIVSELYIGCSSSTVQQFAIERKQQPNQATIITFCNCSVKQITDNVTFGDLAQEMVVKNYNRIKQASETCKQISPVESVL